MKLTISFVRSIHPNRNVFISFCQYINHLFSFPSINICSNSVVMTYTIADTHTLIIGRRYPCIETGFARFDSDEFWFILFSVVLPLFDRLSFAWNICIVECVTTSGAEPNLRMCHDSRQIMCLAIWIRAEKCYLFRWRRLLLPRTLNRHKPQTHTLTDTQIFDSQTCIPLFSVESSLLIRIRP